jgi:hypothetical protein
MRIEPAGINRVPGGLHEQWPIDTTIPTWAKLVVVGLTTVMLKRIGGPPGQTVLLPCAATVTSMPPADPLNPGLGTCAAGEVTARWLDGEVTAGWLDGEADCAAAVVPEPIGVGVPELEQPTSAATVAAPTNAATIVKGLFGIICVPSRGGVVLK